MDGGELLFFILRNVAVAMLGLILAYLIPKLATAGMLSAYRDHLRAMAEYIVAKDHNKEF